MNPKKFLMAVDIYKSNGGKLTCSPNQSCEGDTSDSVILKDFHGHVVAEVVLPTKTVTLASQDGRTGTLASVAGGSLEALDLLASIASFLSWP